MPTVSPGRSLETLRLPVDRVGATLILQDGKRVEATLFVPPGEDVTRYVDDRPGFVPILRDGKLCFVAKTAIACVGVVQREDRSENELDLPVQRQAVVVEVTSGMLLVGTMQWAAPQGRQRTADHLNEDARHLEVRAGELTYLISKAHIRTVEER